MLDRFVICSAWQQFHPSTSPRHTMSEMAQIHVALELTMQSQPHNHEFVFKLLIPVFLRPPIRQNVSPVSVMKLISTQQQALVFRDEDSCLLVTLSSCQTCRMILCVPTSIFAIARLSLPRSTSVLWWTSICASCAWSGLFRLVKY